MTHSSHTLAIGLFNARYATKVSQRQQRSSSTCAVTHKRVSGRHSRPRLCANHTQSHMSVIFPDVEKPLLSQVH